MKIAVNGALGRMGRTVIRLAREEDIEVVLAIDPVSEEPLRGGRSSSFALSFLPG